MSRIFQEKEIVTLIDGLAGKLELKINGLPAAETPRGLAVICHPHPLYGGNFDNKVCSTLARAVRESGFIAVRFNFRGVGASEGQHDDGCGELMDLSAVIGWLKQQLPALPLVLAGFSFGGAIAAAYTRDHPADITRLILVSPALGRYGFAWEDRIVVPLLLVQGEADEVLPVEPIYQWVQECDADLVTLLRLADTGHFYHGKLTPLKTMVVDYLLT